MLSRKQKWRKIHKFQNKDNNLSHAISKQSKKVIFESVVKVNLMPLISEDEADSFWYNSIDYQTFVDEYIKELSIQNHLLFDTLTKTN